jgi:hypothetical protein
LSSVFRSRGFRFAGQVLLLPAVLAVVSCECDDDDDDDCHTHVLSTGETIIHCHDDDDFDDDDDFHHLKSSDGEVAVLVTDSPRADLQAVHLTIREVVLQSGEVEPQPIYRSSAGRRVELLSLRRAGDVRLHELIAGRVAVKGASYDSVIVALGEPSLVLASGAAVTGPDIEVAGGGTIEVGLREPILVGPGELVFLSLDLDVERSVLDAPREGGKPRWRLRPVVLVEAIREEALAALGAPLEVAGSVKTVDAGRGSFSVEPPDGAGILDVVLGTAPVLLVPGLEPAGLDALAPGTPVSVRGDFDGEGKLEARSVAAGATFVRRGILRDVSAAAAAVHFTLEDGENQERLALEAGPDTSISFRRVEIGVLADLESGLAATVTAASGRQGLPAAAVRIDIDTHTVPASMAGRVPAPPGTAPQIDGVITAVDARERKLRVKTAAGERSLDVPRESSLFLLEAAGGVTVQKPLLLEEVPVGARLEGAKTEDGVLLLLTTEEGAAARP